VTWILRLYPRVWRRRYGVEVAEMLAGRGFSLAVAVDLVAGAIDVWLHPSATLAAAAAARSASEEKTMLQRIIQFDCAAMAGLNLTKADHWRSAAVAIGGTVVLTAVWMYVHVRVGDNPYTDSLSVLAFLIPYIFSLRYTYLKHRPVSVQAVFIAGFSLILTLMMLAAGWISAQI
jgi:hypothetical protein